jgi:hypothetical protein
MPEVSRFFGIIVRMYSEPGSVHNEPHFHVYYQGDSAVYAISSGSIIAGSLPRRQQSLIEAWCELHQEELLVDWNLLLDGHIINPIKPLE